MTDLFRRISTNAASATKESLPATTNTPLQDLQKAVQTATRPGRGDAPLRWPDEDVALALEDRSFWLTHFAPYKTGPKTTWLLKELDATTESQPGRLLILQTVTMDILVSERALLVLRTISETHLISATATFMEQLRAHTTTAALPDPDPKTLKKRKVANVEEGVARVVKDRAKGLTKLEEKEAKLLVQTFERLQKIAAKKAELEIKVAAAEQEAAKRARITIEQE